MMPSGIRSWSLAWHVLILLTGSGYGAWRWEALQRDFLPPTPQIEPCPVMPRHQRPQLVDPARLHKLLKRLEPDFGSRKPPINYVDHALRLWGVTAEFQNESAMSGVELRSLLLDHRAFIDAWGPETKPFLIPDTHDSILRFRTQNGPATASHVDHTLAGLAEVGTPLDFPVLTPQGERPLADALDEALREFSLNQEEYEWSTLVFLHYLPDVRQWYSTEGQLITWDRLADRLMRQRLNQGVCFGLHRVYVLAALLVRDDERKILSTGCRARIETHLRDVTRRLSMTQHPNGYWDGSWPGAEVEGPAAEVAGPLGTRADRLLATGHILEWWAYAPDSTLPDESVLQRAIDWLMADIESLSDTELRRFYPFLTHAGRALVLLSGHGLGLEAHTSSANGVNDR